MAGDLRADDENIVGGSRAEGVRSLMAGSRAWLRVPGETGRD
jgi:hypothetical protein